MAAPQLAKRPGWFEPLQEDPPPQDVAEGWQEWWPRGVFAMPLKRRNGQALGWVCFLLEQPPTLAQARALRQVAQTWSYCWEMLAGKPKTSLWQRWRGLKKSWRIVVVAALLGLLLMPVRQTALAPGEVVALDALAVAAPLDGVIQTVHVRPNQAVKANDVLFSLDDTTLRRRLEVALRSVAVADAEYLSATQQAFDSAQSRSELALLSGRAHERRAELAAIQAQLDRVEIRAPRDGVVVFGDPDDWLGRPVKLFLTTQPLAPLSGTVIETSYQAVLSPEGVASYRLRAAFDEGEVPARIGLRGTAKLYGERVALGYYLMRRPLATLREWTWLRRSLLGWDEPYAEVMPPRQRRGLVAFALATWLYRLMVFLAIALAVYFLFFKVLGIFLMVVELAWFVVRPVSTELAVWRKRWSETPMNRRRGWALVLLLAVVALFFPWALDVKLPGVAHPERQQYVYAPVPAQVQAVQPEGAVAQGTLLARFAAPELQGRAERAQAAAYALDQRLAGLADDRSGREQHLATIARLREQLREAQAVDEEAARLRVQAEFDGLWVDVDPLLGPGAWVGSRDLVGVLVDPGSWVVDAYVDQREVQRIRSGAQARFRGEGELRSHPATVIGIDTARSQRLLYPMLAAPHGGTVSVLQEGQDAQPAEVLYRVRLKLDASLPALRELRGQVRIEGPRQSLPWELTKRGMAVLIRESGF